MRRMKAKVKVEDMRAAELFPERTPVALRVRGEGGNRSMEEGI